MGTVYRGVNVKIGTPIAIKVLNPEFLQDPVIRERFRREAMVSSRVTSNYLVRVLDLCTEPDGYAFLIMEWLSGTSLADFLHERRELYVGEVLTLVSQVGEGLEVAHRAGIVHRDIKPGNIFLERSALGDVLVPKIVDFGLSKVIEAGGQLTAAATMMGTPHYMPVEQFNNSAGVDARADVYSLGVIAYEALTGHRPFCEGTPVQILNDIMTRDPDPLPDVLPPTMASVIMRAMAKDREQRWRTAAELVSALNAAAQSDGIEPQPLVPLAVREPRAPATEVPAPPQQPIANHPPSPVAGPPSPAPPGPAPAVVGPPTPARQIVAPPKPGPPMPAVGAYAQGVPAHRPRPRKTKQPVHGWLIFTLTLGAVAVLAWLMLRFGFF